MNNLFKFFLQNVLGGNELLFSVRKRDKNWKRNDTQKRRIHDFQNNKARNKLSDTLDAIKKKPNIIEFGRISLSSSYLVGLPKCVLSFNMKEYQKVKMEMLSYTVQTSFA